jgi:hypothetical protein
MHPHTFYSTLFEPQKRDEVFVIMSFAPEFDERWLRVIEPCIREDLVLKPHRVDYNVSGESILHDILDGIAHARLVLADITSSRMTDASGAVWPQRNGNVMLEVGWAQLMRVPDEVIVIRSDSDPSIFDLTQFRAFQYDPADVAGSRHWLAALAKDRMRAVEQAASDHVSRCASSLDLACMVVLIHAAGDGISPPVTKNLGQVVGNMATVPAIARLLEMGALTTSFASTKPDMLHLSPADALNKLLRYRVTPFGMAVYRYCLERLGLLAPAIVPLLQKMSQELTVPSGN